MLKLDEKYKLCISENLEFAPYLASFP